MTPKEMSAVLLAFDAGAEIESRVKGTLEWVLVRSPNWDFSVVDFRVKAKPREFWIVQHVNNHNLYCAYPCQQLGVDNVTQIHVREVTE